MQIVGEAPMRARTGVTMAFDDSDLKGVKFPHNDPMVITLIIGNNPIKRILVDNGASVDILLHDTFFRMGYNDSQLTPTDMPIYGFAGVECPVEGIIKLPTTIGQEPRVAPENTEKVTFVGATLEEPLIGKLVKFLQENSDVFAWSAADMPGIDPELINHKLNVDPSRKTVKQKKRSFAPER
ncbi:hypothetical protein AgCh_009293 [Apium graveolens]